MNERLMVSANANANATERMDQKKTTQTQQTSNEQSRTRNQIVKPCSSLLVLSKPTTRQTITITPHSSIVLVLVAQSFLLLLHPPIARATSIDSISPATAAVGQLVDHNGAEQQQQHKSHIHLLSDRLASLSSSFATTTSDDVEAPDGEFGPRRAIGENDDASDPTSSKAPPPSTRSAPNQTKSTPDNEQVQDDKRLFVMELFTMLHEQYGSGSGSAPPATHTKEPVERLENRHSLPAVAAPRMMTQLLEAIGSNGDVRRLIDWVRHSFSPALLSELMTHFVVSKLGSVNCPALLQPDKEETLVPRFLLFNDQFVDVPFELSINPSAQECAKNANFDPTRRTIVLIHGFLAGYTLVDGITNIKNRLLDLNKFTRESALGAFVRASQNNSTYVLTDDLHAKVRQNLYNVIVVDWFNGANPVPRGNYIRAAVNSQVVGRLIARFLSALIVQCGTPAANLQIIAHSLGCHVSGFTGKALNAAGHRLGKITHLDPVGLCFGRLFSRPSLRLSPNDALETQAVHVSLNIFDNPLDGAHSNFLVNGGRDQIDCGGNANEVKNSTSSSIMLLFDPAARFAPCSHLRALALFEEDLSSEPGQCQMVGYRCANYDRFLAGKCGLCDSLNGQCRLMSLAPLSMKFRELHLSDNSIRIDDNLYSEKSQRAAAASAPRPLLVAHDLGSTQQQYSHSNATSSSSSSSSSSKIIPTVGQQHHYAMALPEAHPSPAGKQEPFFGMPSSYYTQVALQMGDNHLRRRSDRRLDQQQQLQGKRLIQVIDKIRQDTRSVLAEGWSSLRNLRSADLHSQTQSPQTKSSPSDVEQTSSTVSSAQHPLVGPPATTTTISDLSNGLAASVSGQAATTATTSTTTHTTPPPQPPPQPSHWPDTLDAMPAERLHEDLVDRVPLGGQAIPRNSQNSPLFYLGASPIAPYCVNYYQFRVLIAESRIQRIMGSNALAPNRMAALIVQQTLAGSVANVRQRLANLGSRDMLHLTVKLTDTSGHFFKGFSMLENARYAPRVLNEPTVSSGSGRPTNEPMLELTMLLNSTRPEPKRIGETIISYYFHPIVLADRVEVNYMSNISPE